MAISRLVRLALVSLVTCSSVARGSLQKPLDVSTCLASSIFPDPPKGSQALHTPAGSNGLWEVRMTADKGRGLFAVVDITRGTRLLTENPLVTVKPPPIVPGRGFQLSAMLAPVEEAFHSLTPKQQEEYLSCHEVRFGDEGRDEDAAAAMAKTKSKTTTVSGGRLLRILRSNAYNMQDGRVGLYPNVALINHDCRPNVLNTDLKGSVYKVEGLQRVIVATRDIQAGEEIVTTYVPLLADTETRRTRLNQYGFVCNCASCRSSRDDEERVQMKQILDDVTAVAKQASKVGAKEHAARAAVLAQYIRDNGFADYGAQTSQLAAELSVRAGDLKTAATWAAIHVEVVQLANAEGAESDEVRQARALLRKIKRKLTKK
ncbi:set domain-containing protein 5 [Ophiostoma piceae UAMH 11346]|uniref:Set domain-containing protein 5 n=1 Tax=Ophiostoma piceae (strain UAMH 11346) TaxID=1262450 RepID=S3CD76_OPHP1|nr:set domain-containing protein 5 [Ophiostoma piceae UAMH 11346]